MWFVSASMADSRLASETWIALPPLTFKLFSMHRVLSVVVLAGILSGCVRVKMDPIEVNANVNVNVKLDQALNDFFGDLDKQSTSVK